MCVAVGTLCVCVAGAMQCIVVHTCVAVGVLCARCSACVYICVLRWLVCCVAVGTLCVCVRARVAVGVLRVLWCTRVRVAVGVLRARQGPAARCGDRTPVCAGRPSARARRWQHRPRLRRP